VTWRWSFNIFFEMNREVLDRWCERAILWLVLVILVLGPVFYGAVRSLEFGIIAGLTSLVTVLWGVRLWLNSRPQLLWPPICWAVLAFTLYALARYFTSDIEYVARHEVLRVLVYAFLFLAVLNNLHRQESTQTIAFTLLFTAMAISFYAIYQFVTDSDRVWSLLKPYPHRGSGTYICPNHLAGFLEILLPLGLAYTVTGRMKPLIRVLIGYMVLVILAGLIVSLSRGGWLAAAASLVWFFGILMFQRGYRLPAFLALSLILAVALVAIPRSFGLKLRMRRMVSEQGQVNDGLRFSLWRPAIQLWQENLWWGAGPAHFDPRFHAYRPEGVQLSPERAHNDYLNTLADWGLVGTVLVASAWVLLGFGVAGTWSSIRLSSGDLGGKSGSNKFAFVVGASGGLVAILFHSLVDFNMHIPANAILVVTLMALISGHLRFATERWWSRMGLTGKALISVVMLAGVSYLALQAWVQVSEFLWIERAKQMAASSVDRIAMLKRAHAVDPMNPETTYRIAQAYQQESQEGSAFYSGQEGVNYQRLAEQAMDWYQRGMKLNRWDSRNYTGYGWCLDWLDRGMESPQYFAKAEELDPNSYFTLNRIGLHYVQSGDYAAAKPWFERSLRMEWKENPVARNYLQISNLRLLETATNVLEAGKNLNPR
jgi:O-antigen ligase